MTYLEKLHADYRAGRLTAQEFIILVARYANIPTTVMTEDALTKELVFVGKSNIVLLQPTIQ